MVKSILHYLGVIHSPNLHQLFILTLSTDTTWRLVSLTYTFVFHAWVTIVRKKWLSLYYSTYWCYIHQTYTNCLFWHDLLMPRSGLCPWTAFHAWVTMVRKKWLRLYYNTYWCYIHETYTNYSSWHDLLMPRSGLCPWPTFQASVTKMQNGNRISGAPVLWWFPSQ